ncbi:MAG: Mfa1 family fimbria major subunit [Muribaculaceae bacterium]
MKKLKLFAMAFIALAMFSCSKDEENGGNTPQVVEGVETYATFNFNVEGGSIQDRGGSETDAGKTDDVVKDIRIAIFKVGTPSILEYTGVVDVSGTNAKTLEPIKITSGEKRIFVFANSKNLSIFPTLTQGTTTLEQCYASLMHLGHAADGTADVTKFTVESITSDANGFFMSNARSLDSKRSLLPNISSADSKAGTGDVTKNNFSFNVYRGVAKVNAKLKDANVKILKRTDGTTVANLADLSYTVRNINKCVRPVQLFSDINIEEKDILDNGILPQAAYFNTFDGYTDTQMKDKKVFESMFYRGNDIDQILQTYSTDMNPATSVIVTENTNARQVIGNTSYLAVKATYIPTKLVESCKYDGTINSGTFTPTEVANTKVVTFFSLNLGGLPNIGEPGKGLSNNLFSTEAAAKTLLGLVLAQNKITDAAEIAEQEAARIKTYTNGVSFYRLNIGVTYKAGGLNVTNYGIQRNSTYAITISKINKLGVSTEGELDDNPETPVGTTETYVTATIVVKGWNALTQDGEL